MTNVQVRTKSKTYQFLKKRSTTSAREANILCFFGGKYHVKDDEYSEFLRIYANDAGHFALGLIERKSDPCRFFLDIDGAGVSLVCSIIEVMKRDIIGPILVSTIHSDAIEEKMETLISHRKMKRYHVIYPNLIVTSEVALHITKSLQQAMQDSLPDYDWCSIIDDSVAKHNGLRMLGSYKAKDLDGLYYIPCEIDLVSKTVTDIPIDYDVLENYSIRVRTQTSETISLSNVKFSEFANTEEPQEYNNVSFDALKCLVMALPAQFYAPGSYTHWSRVIWTIKNLSERGTFEEKGKELAHQFSKQSDTVYNVDHVNRLWEKARVGCRNLLGWRYLLSTLKENGMHDMVKEVCADAQIFKGTVVAEWKQTDLVGILSSAIGIDESCEFTFNTDTISFSCGHIRGDISRRDLSVYVNGEFKCYLTQNVPVPGNLSLVHKDISDSAHFDVKFDKFDDSAVLNATNASILWHHPWSEESFLTVKFEGARRGNAIQKRKIIQYLQKRVENGIHQYLEQNFNITTAHFQNCTFNVSLATAEDNRRAEGVLVKMLLHTRPELKDYWKFCPDMKTNYSSGFFSCKNDAFVWIQTHNNAVETALRSAFESVKNLTTAEQKYIQTRKGITDIRGEFASAVLDQNFMSTLDTNLDIFVLRNGVLDMTKKEFRPTTPEDYVKTYADWNYSATESKQFMPALRQFVEQIFPVEKERKLLLLYTAGLLSGRRLLKKLIALTDKRDGNNGKTTWINLLKIFFSNYAKCNSKFFNKGSFERDRDSHDAGFQPFAGIRLTILEELKRTSKIDESTVKNLTGGPGVMVEGRKCGSSETFKFVWQSGFYMIFNEDDCPQFDVTDSAFIQRIIVGPMRSKFVAKNSPELLQDNDYTFEVNPDISSQFPCWRSALLDLLLEHYDPTFTGEDMPAGMMEWRSNIASTRNILSDWLEAHLERTQNHDNYVLLSDIKNIYIKQTRYQKGGLGAHEFGRIAKSWFKSNNFSFKDSDNIKGEDKKFKKERNVIRCCIMKSNLVDI
jgi:phage/plasmid-associated DNA primase